MGFRLSSFIGGVAKGFNEQIEKQEEVDTEQIQANIKSMYLGYAEQKKDVAKRKDELRGVYDFFKGVKFSDGSLDNDQMIGLLSNPSLAKTVKKKIEENPEYVGKVSRNFVKAAADTPKDVDPADWIDTIFNQASATEDQLKTLFGEKEEGNFIQRMASTDKLAQARRAAAQLGVPLERLVGSQTKDVDTLPSMGEVDIGVFGKGPSSVADVVKDLELQRYRVGQEFGKNSDRYIDLDKQVKEAQGEIVKADTKLEDRRDRLEMQRRDSTDPAVVAALTKEINGINSDIKERREATSTKSERDGDGSGNITYSKAKTRMEDYMNSDMVLNKGLGWRKYVEDKVVFDPATQKNITIPGKKVGLTAEQEKEYAEGMTAARMQGLKELGLVTAEGKPVNNEVKDLIVAYKLNRPTAAPAPAPAPSTSAAIPTAQPTKVVSRATVQAQADKNKVTYEVAAAEARKQGYTIR